jgi:5'-nucleotidase
MNILVDQDGPLADFEGEFHRRWRETYPDRHHIPPAERRVFKLNEEYGPEHSAAADEIVLTRGFFRDLPPVPGAVEAMETMLAAGHDVRICTAPVKLSLFCVGEKYNWVRQHLGQYWMSRVIISSDKTFVYGDYLIDDKPDITGAIEPAWEHVIYEAPYNRHANGGRRLASWKDWPQLIG